MKKRNYFSFLIGKLIAGLLIGSIIFGASFIMLDRMYDSAISMGFYDREEKYKQIIKSINEKDLNNLFIDIITTFYAADYIRFAKVNEDGSLENLFETNYDVIPVEENMNHWYYVTNDKELLAKGKKTCHINDADWIIEYKKCDELWDICNQSESRIINSWDLCAMTDGYYSNLFLYPPVEFSGAMQYYQPLIKTFYVENDTLHPGKVVCGIGQTGVERGKKWDFTDKANADKYGANIITNDISSDLAIFRRNIRPDKILDENKELFFAKNLSELLDKEAYSGNSDRYNHYIETQDENGYIRGRICVVEIDGNKYVIEYVMRTVSFGVFAKPFLLLYAAFLFVLCVVISCLSAIKPYRQYKKAYENNIFKNNLIDSLAHNLKTPLQILGGYAENLKDVSGDAEKDRYADQILAKTAEMNKDIEAILKTAEKSDRKFVKESVRTCIDEVASKLGAEVFAKGDMNIRMDKDYFKTAVYCILDNAMKYKSADSKVEVDITCNTVTIKNRTDKDKFTPGTGIAIAGRILEQHKLKMRTTLKDGVFECKFGKRLGKK